MRTDRFYKNHLQKYFDKYFKDYDETAEYYVDPAPNKWRFAIPELGIDILLTCYDDGKVVETRKKHSLL